VRRTTNRTQIDPEQRRCLIDRSVHELYKQFSHDALLQSFPVSIAAPDTTSEDPILQVQEIAHAIATHLHVDVRAIIVSFRSDLGPAANVELSSEEDFFVEIDPRYKNDCDLLNAVLAHEVTHIFLHRNHVRFPDELQNEILTDTTAAYLGLGPMILNAHKTTHSLGSRGLFTSTTHKPGYLSATDFGYIVAERAYRFGDAPAQLLHSAEGRAAFRKGKKAVRARLRRPPYMAAPLWRRAAYSRKLAGVSKYSNVVDQHSLESVTHIDAEGYAFGLCKGLKVRFRCAACNRGLQVPVGQSEIEVRCPTCGCSHRCYT